MTETQKLRADWLRMYDALSSLRATYPQHHAIGLICDGAILGLQCDHPHGVYVAPKTPLPKECGK